MILALAFVLATAEPDPRVQLVELQLEQRHGAALALIDSLLEERPELAGPLGLHYLRGELLDGLGRRAEAAEAFADALGSSPLLADYSRYRLAQSQAREGHPEVATGLLATLLGGSPPPPLVRDAAKLFVQTLDEGGDCRLLARRRSWRLPRPEERLLQLAAADCHSRNGDAEAARAELEGLLAGGGGDNVALEAAARLRAGWSRLAAPTVLQVGLTLHQHRDFSASSQLLRQALAGLEPTALSSQDLHEARYALARNSFWLGEFPAAASAFEALVVSAHPSERIARALYQQGRSHELEGNWSAASNSYRRAYLAEPEGRWAAAALVSALRIEWRSGREEPALEAYRLLTTRREWGGMLARAGLYLAASDIVRGRADRAGSWLAAAERHRRTPVVETAFWRGRLSEVAGQVDEAVRFYLRALRSDPSHPLGREAAARLGGELAAAARARARRQASAGDLQSLYEAWLALGDDDPAGASARRRLEAALERDPRSRSFLEAELVPPADWPLWQTRLHQPEELLLALGLWQQGAPAVMKHFPVSDVSLAYTGGRLLSVGGRPRQSLYVAEVLYRRLPSHEAHQLLPTGFRRLLFPFPYRSSITREADRRGVDPHLLAAIIREESRFDPEAVSPASARGLTQFILPTARRLAASVELADLEAADLHRPELSIALGAAYLAELSRLFGGREHIVVAAYNAGEPQAQLWRSYCYSHEPAEYFSKVGFPQTRNYLAKVLSSRVQYAELYGGIAAD